MSVSFANGLVMYKVVTSDIQEFVYYTTLGFAHTVRAASGSTLEITWKGVDALDVMTYHDVNTETPLVSYRLVREGAQAPVQSGARVVVKLLSPELFSLPSGIRYYGTGVILYPPEGYRLDLEGDYDDFVIDTHQELVVGTSDPVYGEVTLVLKPVYDTDAGSICGETSDGVHLLVHDDDAYTS